MKRRPPATTLAQRLATLLLPCLLLPCLLLFAPPGAANEGAGPAGPVPLNFVANLGNPASGGQMLVVEVVLAAASPEVDAKTKAYLPKIRHQIILLLSEALAPALRSREGKEGLAEKIRDSVNLVLQETTKTGVTEALFTKFLIQ